MDGTENYNKPIWPKDDTERELVERGRERDKLAADAALRSEARRHTYAVRYPSRAFRIEANWDAEYGAEWALSEAALLADENATLTAQLADYAITKERYARERILHDDARRQISAQKAQIVQTESTLSVALKMLDATIAERDEMHVQITALMTERDEALNPEPMAIVKQQWDDIVAERNALREERDTLAAKLDAATARISELENAALGAEPATPSDDELAERVTVAGQNAAHWYRLYTLEKAQAAQRSVTGASAGDDMPCSAIRMDSATERKARTPKFEPPTRIKPDPAA